MTKRELVFGAALLFMGTVAAMLWLHLQAARQQISASQAPLSSAAETLRQADGKLREEAAVSPAPAPASPMPVPIPGGQMPVSSGQVPTFPAAPPAAMEPDRASKGFQLAQASTIFGSNDLNSDGIVTKEEAAKANKALIRMWDRYDSNKDGVVVAAEINDVNGVTNGAASTGGLGAAMVANNDLNRDGTVTKEEAQAANKSLIGMWDRYDANRDGKLDPTEVARAARGQGGRAGRP